MLSVLVTLCLSFANCIVNHLYYWCCSKQLCYNTLPSDYTNYGVLVSYIYYFTYLLVLHNVRTYTYLLITDCWLSSYHCWPYFTCVLNSCFVKETNAYWYNHFLLHVYSSFYSCNSNDFLKIHRKAPKALFSLKFDTYCLQCHCTVHKLQLRQLLAILCTHMNC